MKLEATGVYIALLFSGCVYKVKAGLPVTPTRTNTPRAPLVPGGDRWRMRRIDEETSIKQNQFLSLWAVSSWR
jgi:antitoxin (DNA-binding transcriptional repressor) of toxin-antitoxin stability system